MADDPGLGAYIARGIKARRVWLQLDQAALGRRMGVSGQTISNIELGNRKVTVDDLVPLCRALETTLAQLLAGADEDDLRTVGLA